MTDKMPKRYFAPFLIYFLTLTIACVAFVSHPSRSVSRHYEEAANQWLGGESLYAKSMESGQGFLYLPHAAILHLPYALTAKVTGVPWMGDLLWRICSWLVFSIAAARATRLFSDAPEIFQWRMALACLILGLSCLRIGQSTLMMTGLILLSAEAWANEKWRFAALLIIISIAVKPLALTMMLLMFALTPQMRTALVLGALSLVLAPFLLQNPTYVVTQYQDCWTMMQTASQLGDNFQWAQLFGMLNVFGVTVNAPLQTMIRIAFALIVLAAAILASKRLVRVRQTYWLIVWTCIYLMLFNPRTENSTYCMLAPIYGLLMGQLLLKSKPLSFIALFGAILTATSYELGNFLTPEGEKSIWLAPMICCGLAICLSIQFYTELRFSNADEENVPAREPVSSLT